jgi:hypothetical protein
MLGAVLGAGVDCAGLGARVVLGVGVVLAAGVVLGAGAVLEARVGLGAGPVLCAGALVGPVSCAGVVLAAVASAELGASSDHACLPVGALAVQLEELPVVTGDAAAFEPLLPYRMVVTCIRWQYIQ